MGYKRSATRQVGAGELPIFSAPTIPSSAKLILLVDEINYDIGGKMEVAYQLPIERLTGGTSFSSNSHSIYAPTAGISVPEGAAIPAFRETFGSFELKRAQANSNTTLAQFLIVRLDPNVDQSYIVTANGFYEFPVPHNYAIGQTYYLDENNPGQVTTTPPALAQRLFTVVDQRTILVNIER